jgi:hypothetical protein
VGNDAIQGNTGNRGRSTCPSPTQHWRVGRSFLSILPRWAEVPSPTSWQAAASNMCSLLSLRPRGAILLLGLLPFLFAGCAMPVKVKGSGDNWYATARITRF